MLKIEHTTLSELLTEVFKQKRRVKIYVFNQELFVGELGGVGHDFVSVTSGDEEAVSRIVPFVSMTYIELM